ncbi:hypothetical protein [Dasania marina]|uniref:hypothetical protein n=1 Tax=Dasania marina TaxID=471499 RepID=UPI0030D75FCF|tara:strand:- start:82 stop:420 length:339 start_codon:yes stop_codon:yes gene_type:complete
MNKSVASTRRVLWAALLFAAPLYAAQEIELLPAQDYRIEMEEIVVKGVIPEWRIIELEQELWNRNRFKLMEQQLNPRIEWFPQYTKDERDSALEPKNRTEEKPEIKLFEWLF